MLYKGDSEVMTSSKESMHLFGIIVLLLVYRGTVYFSTIFKLALAVAQETVVPVVLPETSVTIEC